MYIIFNSAADRKTGYKWILKAAAIILTGIVAVTFVYNDYSLYDKPVAKVLEVEQRGNTQIISLQLVSKSHRGRLITLSNTYDEALVYDEKYHKGDQVFLSKTEKHITGVKRDYQLAAAVVALLSLLLIIGGKQGRRTIYTLLANIFIFSLLLRQYLDGRDILWLSIAGCAAMTSLVVISICGLSKALAPSLASTLLSLLVVGGLVFTLLHVGSGINYEYLEFLPEPYTQKAANHFFFAQCLMGCLGAVTDIAVTITACSRELIRKTPGITTGKLMNSMKEVSDDVTGTMINVVFCTNIAATIPTFIVSMKNKVSFLTVLKYSAFFDIARFLVGAIAILIAIPISMYCTVFFFRRKKASL